MHYRRFGRMGFEVSELSCGTWGLDDRLWKDADAVEAAAAIRLALELGINFIDTAAAYGHAETFIGNLLVATGLSRRVAVATKVAPVVPMELPSPHIRADEAFPGQHIRESVERSLRALRVERVALLQLHSWSSMWLGEGDWLETLGRLQKEGKIAGIGVSLFDHDPDAALDLVASGHVDAVQVMYNLFDQGPAAVLFEACLRHDVAVIVRSPLYAGALSNLIGLPQPFHAEDWRREYFYDDHLEETRRRVRALRDEVGGPDRSVSDLALRFCLSHPAVSTVAVGMRKRRHVYENLRVANGPVLPPERVAHLSRHAWLC